MDTTKLERGIIGDFLMSHVMFSPTPLKGVVGAKRLRPEHFTDSSARAAFEAIMTEETDDPMRLTAVVEAKEGIEFTNEVCSLASTVGAQAVERIATLAEKGRIRLALDKIAQLRRIENNATEGFFFSELSKIAAAKEAPYARRFSRESKRSSPTS